MSVLMAVVLGIIQGLSEFLPISSSGHLVLFQKIFDISEIKGIRGFDVFLHVGTLVPVLIVFKKEIIGLIKRPFQKMTLLLIIGTLPLVLAQLLFGDFIDSLFQGKGLFLGIGFIITGTLLLYADTMKDGYKKGKDITYLDALIIGCVQTLAIPPAISRSGSTITGALFCNLKRETAAKFSFLLSIPAILGAFTLELYEVYTSGDSFLAVGVLPICFGFVASMLTGYLAIRFMLNMIKQAKLKVFSFYVFGLAVVIIFDSLVTHILF